MQSDQVVKKYYAVTRGRTIGIFTDWLLAHESVNGFPGAIFTGYKTLEEAKQAMEKAGHTNPVINPMDQTTNKEPNVKEGSNPGTSALAAPDAIGENKAGEEQELAKATKEMTHLNLEPSGSPIPYYIMDRTPRGFCLIINNRKFSPDGKRVMDDREGTNVDKERLERTFQNLHFQVRVEDDCTDTRMVSLINEMAAQDHGHFDCFVCCILTHGGLGILHGTNGKQVPIRDLTSPLRADACPSLAGKPKLFFIQACQGNEHQQGQAVQADSLVDTDSPPDLIPNEADFSLGFATVLGFVAYRSRTEGSWYITKLTEAIDRYAFSLDIGGILTLVNYEVGQLNTEKNKKQSPAFMSSLRKTLVFKRPA